MAKAPLHLIDHPFKTSLKTFGMDEGIAGIMNVTGTALLSSLNVQNKLLLTIGGPLIEKLGFFPRSFYEAYQMRKHTPENERLKLSKYFQAAVLGSGKSLAKDLLLHDPLYGMMMYTGLEMNATTPPWIISFVSFVMAVFVVSGIERGYEEGRYQHLKNILRDLAFSFESYKESRIQLNHRIENEAIFDLLHEPFHLENHTKRNYFDTYYPTHEKLYGGRKLNIRVRTRIQENGGEEHDPHASTQSVFTKPLKMTLQQLDQFNYFYIKKDKFYHEGNSASSMSKYIQQNKSLHKISFQREVSANPAGLMVAVDTVPGRGKMVELKVHHGNEFILKQSIEKLLNTFGGLQQITLGKHDMIGEI